MKNNSSLDGVHYLGKFGNFENKDQSNLIKLKEIKNLEIYQLARFKNSKKNLSEIRIDNLKLPETLGVSNNSFTRILWMGPNTWNIMTTNKELEKNLLDNFDKNEFAVTKLSQSRAIIQIEGDLSKEVLKKGCPLDINSLKKNQCANSIFHGISITIDCLSETPSIVRISCLRSFGHSLYHGVTDACLEFGYITA